MTPGVTGPGRPRRARHQPRPTAAFTLLLFRPDGLDAPRKRSFTDVMDLFGDGLVTLRRLSVAAGATLLLLGGTAEAAAQDPYATARAQMVRTIEAIAAAAGGGATPKILDAGVLDVLRRVPRHEFVPEELRDRAYADEPLPIGYGQTISEPYIVALMTDLLQLAPGGRALEVGTGSGYQAAVLAALGAQVQTIEIVPALAKEAAARLTALGYGAVQTRQADGYYGWPEAAPFDAIVVTAAVPQVPPPLIEQLKPGGRMVLPVGAAFLVQELLLIEKLADRTVRTTALLPVVFVPLTRTP
jgi:protein-L-isoaspartate(D-aspartate) O-methyltransferase